MLLSIYLAGRFGKCQGSKGYKTIVDYNGYGKVCNHDNVFSSKEKEIEDMIKKKKNYIQKN